MGRMAAPLGHVRGHGPHQGAVQVSPPAAPASSLAYIHTQDDSRQSHLRWQRRCTNFHQDSRFSDTRHSTEVRSSACVTLRVHVQACERPCAPACAEVEAYHAS